EERDAEAVLVEQEPAGRAALHPSLPLRVAADDDERGEGAHRVEQREARVALRGRERGRCGGHSWMNGRRNRSVAPAAAGGGRGTAPPHPPTASGRGTRPPRCPRYPRSP